MCVQMTHLTCFLCFSLKNSVPGILSRAGLSFFFFVTTACRFALDLIAVVFLVWKMKRLHNVHLLFQSIFNLVLFFLGGGIEKDIRYHLIVIKSFYHFGGYFDSFQFVVSYQHITLNWIMFIENSLVTKIVMIKIIFKTSIPLLQNKFLFYCNFYFLIKQKCILSL